MTEELDLHFIKHEDVDRLVENFVLLNKLPVRIITGNSDEMRHLVREVLHRHGFSWNQSVPGQITVMEEQI